MLWAFYSRADFEHARTRRFNSGITSCSVYRSSQTVALGSSWHSVPRQVQHRIIRTQCNRVTQEGSKTEL
jgi:hypothetical protein